MAHNIMMMNGVASYAGKLAAWHNLGQVLGHVMTWQEAMQAAHVDWQVEKLQLTHPLTGELIPAFGTFRVQDNERIFLGTVGAQYEVIQNIYAFQFVDTLIQADESKQAHYETAGALGDGQRIWCLARVNNDFTVAGDKHETYLLFTTAHDGSMFAQCKLTTTRVVCQNTLTQALSRNGDAVAKVKHTKSAPDRLAAAKRLLVNTGDAVKDLQTKLTELATRKINKESMVACMKRIYGDYDNATTKRIENKVSEVLNLFEKNDNNENKIIRGTGYNLFNAITEHADHVSTFRRTAGKQTLSDEVIRSENALFGTTAALKENALTVLLEETKDCPRIDITTLSIGTGNGRTDTPLLDNIISTSTM